MDSLPILAERATRRNHACTGRVSCPTDSVVAAPPIVRSASTRELLRKPRAQSATTLRSSTTASVDTLALLSCAKCECQRAPQGGSAWKCNLALSF